MRDLSVRRYIVASLLVPLVAVSGCQPVTPSGTSPSVAPVQATTPTKQIKVVATFLPVYLFTKAVAGNAATVEILIPPGTEVHEYQSTPAAVQAIAQADVLVKNGLGMEEFLDTTVSSAANSKLKLVDASQGINAISDPSPIVSGTGRDDHDHETEAKDDHGHSHADGNPHVWLDPVLAKRQVENIRDGLIAADPANKATYEANAAAYIKQLTALNTQFERQLQPFRGRTFVTFHDAFPYLAHRYQLKQVAVVAVPEDQLAPGDVKKTIATVKQFNVNTIFSEPGVDNKLLNGLAQDLNLKVHSLDSLEAGELDPSYYFIAMQNNLKTLETAFK